MSQFVRCFKNRFVKILGIDKKAVCISCKSPWKKIIIIVRLINWHTFKSVFVDFNNRGRSEKISVTVFFFKRFYFELGFRAQFCGNTFGIGIFKTVKTDFIFISIKPVTISTFIFTVKKFNIFIIFKSVLNIYSVKLKLTFWGLVNNFAVLNCLNKALVFTVRHKRQSYGSIIVNPCPLIENITFFKKNFITIGFYICPRNYNFGIFKFNINIHTTA